MPILKYEIEWISLARLGKMILSVLRQLEELKKDEF